ncbi:enhancer of polycomb homolog 1-like [Saccoglossus kowalevskii]|uniref:Enhancer of polycomb-like protein n=1 Tax=Saccoglossus kowalevskii TaxID=10224 RepID=A0ABM0H140_SACKO|nr:PREDICTED: enhancer of polycomb homolog 1-like [Saccoglossus kowalevskii]
MSKLSFRARALDATKPMPVYQSEELPDLPDYSAINRAVPQMPTGMEKEEESETHLQQAITAQQVYGTTSNLVIPTPEFKTQVVHYEKLYENNVRQNKQYIHVQPLGIEQDTPDYDMDSDDEVWMQKQSKTLEINPLQFEEMMDRLEKGSGQQVVTLPEAKLLLKEDDDLIIAVYDYWLNKRLKVGHTLIPSVKQEKRDGSTSNNPYVAFRRRTEKMQTRKNRKNDEASYEKMLKLRRDLNRAVTLLEMVKRREKNKREGLHLTVEVFEKRFAVGDYSGQLLAECEALRNQRPSYSLPTMNGSQYMRHHESWASKVAEEGGARKKRKYEKRKHKAQNQAKQTSSMVPSYNDLESHYPDLTSEEEPLSPVQSPSDHEDENDPDGHFAFRRKKGCNYYAPRIEQLGNWPWCSREEGGWADTRFRFTCTSLRRPHRCIGFARRRVGRGGRVLLDRAYTQMDEYLHHRDNSSSLPNGLPLNEILREIKEQRLLHFRPRTPERTDESHNSLTVPVSSSSSACASLSQEATGFNAEQFQTHQEQLVQMQKQQQLEQLKQEKLIPDSSVNLGASFCSQPTSKFTLDSATAHFAVSALINTDQCPSLVQPVGTARTINPGHSIHNSAVYEPTPKVTAPGHSLAPAATVLQLNFPITTSTSSASLTSSTGLSVSLTSMAQTSTVDSLKVRNPAAVGNIGTVITTTATKPLAQTTSTVLKLPNSIARETHDSKNPLTLGNDKTVVMEVT